MTAAERLKDPDVIRREIQIAMREISTAQSHVRQLRQQLREIKAGIKTNIHPDIIRREIRIVMREISIAQSDVRQLRQQLREIKAGRKTKIQIGDNSARAQILAVLQTSGRIDMQELLRQTKLQRYLVNPALLKLVAKNVVLRVGRGIYEITTSPDSN